jgi:hypothetical protein
MWSAEIYCSSALLRGSIKNASTEKPLRQRIGFRSHPLEPLGAFVSTASDSLANFKMQINPKAHFEFHVGKHVCPDFITAQQTHAWQVRTQLHVVRS